MPADRRVLHVLPRSSIQRQHDPPYNNSGVKVYTQWSPRTRFISMILQKEGDGDSGYTSKMWNLLKENYEIIKYEIGKFTSPDIRNTSKPSPSRVTCASGTNRTSFLRSIQTSASGFINMSALKPRSQICNSQVSVCVIRNRPPGTRYNILKMAWMGKAYCTGDKVFA